MEDLTFSVKRSILSQLIIVLTVSKGRLIGKQSECGRVGVYTVTGDGDLGNVNMATLTHVALHITSG